MKYAVRTRDVDGRSCRYFKSLAGAVKRFEEMYGYPVANAIADQYYSVSPLPKVEDLRGVRGVSMFGTVVVLERMEG